MRKQSPETKAKATATATEGSPAAGETPPQEPAAADAMTSPPEVTADPVETPEFAPSLIAPKGPKATASPSLIGPDDRTRSPSCRRSRCRPTRDAGTGGSERFSTRPTGSIDGLAVHGGFGGAADGRVGLASSEPMSIPPSAAREPVETAPSVVSRMMTIAPTAPAAADPVVTAPASLATDAPDEPVVALRSMNEPPPAAEAAKDSTLVKVFYGTDRAAPISESPIRSAPCPGLPHGRRRRHRARVLVVLCFFSRGRLILTATGLSVVATAALGFAMANVPRNTKPVDAKPTSPTATSGASSSWAPAR